MATKMKHAPISDEMVEALREFKARQQPVGPDGIVDWKSKLKVAWMHSSEPGLLQQLRNSHGPSWLSSYQLPEELEARQTDMYGATEAVLQEFLEAHVGKGKTFTTKKRAAFSILSDAQEEIAMGRGERARQSINRAKWLLEASR